MAKNTASQGNGDHIPTPAVPLTHPNKQLYPEDNITKKAVFDYYDHICEWILPYIQSRLLTLVRCPEQYQSCFYQKHLIHPVPGLFGMAIPDQISDKTQADYLYIKDKIGLLTLIQMGSLEIHPWGSCVTTLDYPDMIIFDLDPAPDVTWQAVIEAAFELKHYLAMCQLTAFVKSTGGKGLHIVTPIKPEYAWEEIYRFSATFVQLLVKLYPDKYIDQSSKKHRKGKIFIDYLRNQAQSTAIAPYSLRARPQAPVATPLHWDELTSRPEDTFYTLKTLPKRLQTLQQDPWKNFFTLQQSLKLDTDLT